MTKKKEKEFTLPGETDEDEGSSRRTRRSGRKKKIPIEVKKQVIAPLHIGRDLIDFGECQGDYGYTFLQKFRIFARKVEKWNDIIDEYIKLNAQLENEEIDKKWYRYRKKGLKSQLPMNPLFINGEKLNFWKFLWDIVEKDYKNRTCEELINTRVDLNEVRPDTTVAEVGGFINLLVG